MSLVLVVFGLLRLTKSRLKGLSLILERVCLCESDLSLFRFRALNAVNYTFKLDPFKLKL